MPMDHHHDARMMTEQNGNIATTTELNESVRPAADVPPNRDSLVVVAVKFLQNRSVLHKTKEEKTSFLLNKGLTQNEIEEAFSRLDLIGHPTTDHCPMSFAGLENLPCNVLILDQETLRLIREIQPQIQERVESALKLAQPVPATSSSLVSTQGSNRLRDWSLFIVVFGGAFYGCYKLYKDYLIPFLTNEKTEGEKLIETLERTNDTLTKLESKLTKIESTSEQQATVIDRIQNHSVTSGNHDIKELKEELSSLKRLLLNRHQFPESPVQKPIIPSWQLEESLKADLSANSNKKERLNSDEGSEGAPPVSSQQGAQSNTGTHSDGTGHSDIETISQEDSGSDTQTTNTLPVEDASTEPAPTVGPTSEWKPSSLEPSVSFLIRHPSAGHITKYITDSPINRISSQSTSSPLTSHHSLRMHQSCTPSSLNISGSRPTYKDLVNDVMSVRRRYRVPNGIVGDDKRLSELSGRRSDSQMIVKPMGIEDEVIRQQPVSLLGTRNAHISHSEDNRVSECIIQPSRQTNEPDTAECHSWYRSASVEKPHMGQTSLDIGRATQQTDQVPSKPSYLSRGIQCVSHHQTVFPPPSPIFRPVWSSPHLNHPPPHISSHQRGTPNSRSDPFNQGSHTILQFANPFWQYPQNPLPYGLLPSMCSYIPSFYPCVPPTAYDGYAPPNIKTTNQPLKCADNFRPLDVTANANTLNTMDVETQTFRLETRKHQKLECESLPGLNILPHKACNATDDMMPVKYDRTVQTRKDGDRGRSSASSMVTQTVATQNYALIQLASYECLVNCWELPVEIAVMPTCGHDFWPDVCRPQRVAAQYTSVCVEALIILQKASTHADDLTCSTPTHSLVDLQYAKAAISSSTFPVIYGKEIQTTIDSKAASTQSICIRVKSHRCQTKVETNQVEVQTNVMTNDRQEQTNCIIAKSVAVMTACSNEYSQESRAKTLLNSRQQTACLKCMDRSIQTEFTVRTSHDVSFTVNLPSFGHASSTQTCSILHHDRSSITSVNATEEEVIRSTSSIFVDCFDTQPHDEPMGYYMASQDNRGFFSQEIHQAYWASYHASDATFINANTEISDSEDLFAEVVQVDIASSTRSYPSLVDNRDVGVLSLYEDDAGKSMSIQTVYTVPPQENVERCAFYYVEVDNHSTQTQNSYQPEICGGAMKPGSQIYTTNSTMIDYLITHDKEVNTCHQSCDITHRASGGGVIVDVVNNSTQHCCKIDDYIFVNGEDRVTETQVQHSDAHTMTCEADNRMLTYIKNAIGWAMPNTRQLPAMINQATSLESDNQTSLVIRKSSSLVTCVDINQPQEHTTPRGSTSDGEINCYRSKPPAVIITEYPDLPTLPLHNPDHALQSETEHTFEVINSTTQCYKPLCAEVSTQTELPEPPVKITVTEQASLPVLKPSDEAAATDHHDSMDIDLAWNILESTGKVVERKESRSPSSRPTLEPIKEEEIVTIDESPHQPIVPSTQSPTQSLSQANISHEDNFKPTGSKSIQLVRVTKPFKVLTGSRSEGQLLLNVPGIEEITVSNCAKLLESESSSVTDFPTIHSEDFSLHKNKPISRSSSRFKGSNVMMLAHSTPISLIKVNASSRSRYQSIGMTPNPYCNIQSSGDHPLGDHLSSMSDIETLTDGTLTSMTSLISLSSLTESSSKPTSLTDLSSEDVTVAESNSQV